MQANLEHFDRDFLNGSLRTNMQVLEDLIMQKQQEVFPLQTVMAAHWLITRSCLEKVGLFSPSFPHYGEDDNYTNRANYWGFKVGVALNCMAVHDRESREATAEKTVYMSYISAIKNLSNIYEAKSHPLMASSLDMLRSFLKYGRCKQYFSLAFRLFNEYRRIKQNRQESLKEGAFL